MSDIIKTAGVGTLARKPWKAPRLIDLDELDRTECNNGRRAIMITQKNLQSRAENFDWPECYFHGMEAIGHIS